MERIRSLDLARGFTVLFIAPIHTVMLYSNTTVYTTTLGYFLQFIAEGPGAQLFMTLMGMYIAFKPVANGNEVLRRSLMLLLAGYALNVAKFVLPFCFNIIPTAMLQDLQVQKGAGYLQLFCLGDILQFAAPAMILTHWVRRKQFFVNSAIVLAATVLLVSPFLWDASSNNPIINYGLQLIGGQPPKVFFPLLPWVFYPLLGLVIGDAIKRNRENTYKEILKWGIGWLLFGIIAHYIAGSKYETSFYRTYPWDTIGHAGMVLITLWVWEFVDTYIIPNPFLELLEYCSKNITTIYIVQWIVIIWLLPFFGYHELEYCKTLLAILVTSVLTFLSVYLIKKTQH